MEARIGKKYNSSIKIAYYGALASIRNSSAAVGIYENILPKLWLKNNKIEFWIIGSNPPSNIINIGLKDDRVKGYWLCGEHHKLIK